MFLQKGVEGFQRQFRVLVVAVAAAGFVQKGVGKFQRGVAGLFRIGMEFDGVREACDGLVGFVVVQIEPSEPETRRRRGGGAGGVFQRLFINLHRAVVLGDEGNPGEKTVPVPREKLVADLELPLDHLGEIDACDMSFRQFLKTVELRTVLARLRYARAAQMRALTF